MTDATPDLGAVLRLPAGPDLDAIVARIAKRRRAVPPYSTDVNAAMDLWAATKVPVTSVFRLERVNGPLSYKWERFECSLTDYHDHEYAKANAATAAHAMVKCWLIYQLDHP